MKTNNIYLSIIIALLSFSCGEPDYPEPTPSVTIQNGRLLPVNTVVGSNALDITVDNVSEAPGPLFNDLGYAQAVAYKNVPAGANRLVEFMDATDGSTKLADRFSVAASTSYTSFYYTTISANAPAVRRITDVLTTPDVGFAHVRFLHFAKDAPAVKVTNVGGATEYFSSRAYAALGTSNAFTNFSVLSAGTYDFEVRDGSNNVLLTISGQALQSKKIYTIYIRGLVADASLASSIIPQN